MKIETFKMLVNQIDFDLYNGTFKFICFNPIKK